MHRFIPFIARRVLAGFGLVALFGALGGGATSAVAAPNFCDLHPCVVATIDFHQPDPPCDCPIFDPASIVVLPADRFTFGVVNQLTSTAVVSGVDGNIVAQIRPGATGLITVRGPGTYTFLLTAPQVAGTPLPALTVNAERQG